jgi:peptide/nickel transport system substrate-binding protein
MGNALGKSRILLACAVIALLGALTGPLTAAGPAPKRGGHITVVGAFRIQLVDPHSLRSPYLTDQAVLSAIYGGLFNEGPHGEIVPDLAESYDVSEDQKTITLHLRKGVTFHDGTPFNAAAVVWNLRLYADPAMACQCLVFYKNHVTSIDEVNPLTVAIKLNAPYAPFLDVLAGDRSTLMVSPTAYEKAGPDKYGLAPVGAGPFKVDSFVPGVSMTLSAFPKYWQKGHPYLDGITFQSILNPSTAYSAMQTNAAQLDLSIEVNPPVLRQARANPNLRVEVPPQNGYTILFLNSQTAPFNNVAAREAVFRSIDMEPINRVIYDGMLGKAESIFGLGQLFPQVKVAGFPGPDPARVKALVQKLGGLSFIMQAPSFSGAYADWAAALQRQLAANGITTTISPTTTAQQIQNLETGAYQAALQSYHGYADGGMYADLYYKSNGTYRGGVMDKHVDELIARANGTFDKGQRARAFAELAKYLNANFYGVPMYAYGPPLIMAKDLQGIPVGTRIYLRDAYLAGR